MFVVAACILGIWHLYFAAHALFVFRESEPITSWAAIIVGPGSTLFAAGLAIFGVRAGGYWLVAGGVLSILILALGEGNRTDALIPFLARISLPMIITGTGVVLLSDKHR